MHNIHTCMHMCMLYHCAVHGIRLCLALDPFDMLLYHSITRRNGVCSSTWTPSNFVWETLNGVTCSWLTRRWSFFSDRTGFTRTLLLLRCIAVSLGTAIAIAVRTPRV
jgi:hypothetical protein